MNTLTNDDLKKAWKWLKVTTPFQQMLSSPPQKAILIAIAKNFKKQGNIKCPTITTSYKKTVQEN